MGAAFFMGGQDLAGQALTRAPQNLHLRVFGTRESGVSRIARGCGRTSSGTDPSRRMRRAQAAPEPVPRFGGGGFAPPCGSDQPVGCLTAQKMRALHIKGGVDGAVTADSDRFCGCVMHQFYSGLAL